MPRFRRLTATQVREKSSPLDLVTEADEVAAVIIWFGSNRTLLIGRNSPQQRRVSRKKDRARGRLAIAGFFAVALVERFAAYGLSWASGEAAKVTGPTAIAAEMVLRALPAGKALPKIAPDGEGGLMMVWEGRGKPLLLTIDNFRLHGVIAAATPLAEYIDDFPIDEVQVIPRRILDAIPPR